MTIIFTNKALSYLKSSINATDTQLQIGDADYSQFFEAGDGDLYAILRGPTAREIVKIDLSASKYGSYLTVERGQGGSTAAAWPQGTKLFESTHADHYNRILQPGDYRTIGYNPNEILTPLYAGEKVYQDSPSGCERWWKAYNGVDKYWDIITGAPCSSETYQDIGWDFELLLPPP